MQWRKDTSENGDVGLKKEASMNKYENLLAQLWPMLRGLRDQSVENINSMNCVPGVNREAHLVARARIEAFEQVMDYLHHLEIESKEAKQ